MAGASQPPLNLMAEHLGLEHQHHDALSDARVAGWVLVKAMEHTGIDLDGWMAGPWRGQPRRSRGAAPAAADSGPLSGLRVAILGQPRDGPLSREIAAAGGRVVSSVGAKTNLLVVAEARPFSWGIERSATYRRAESLISMGQPLRIISGADTQAMIAQAEV